VEPLQLVLDHYTSTPADTWFWRTAGRLTPRSLLRLVLIRLPPRVSMTIASALARGLLPIHRRLWRRDPVVDAVRSVFRRLSPVFDYYDRYPQLGETLLSEWALLDTHDGLTDRYKHLRTAGQIRDALLASGLTNVEARYAGNGVEARARRPLRQWQR
jgi:hypothetical protein